MPSSENQPSTLISATKGSFLQDRSCWQGKKQHQNRNLRLAGRGLSPGHTRGALASPWAASAIHSCPVCSSTDRSAQALCQLAEPGHTCGAGRAGQAARAPRAGAAASPHLGLSSCSAASHSLGTSASPQLRIWMCTGSVCVSPLHARSARRAGVLLPTRAASCASWGCDGVRQEIFAVIFGQRCPALWQHRRLARSQASEEKPVSRSLQPLPCSQAASSLPEPAASPAARFKGEAHAEELIPWPKLRTRHRRNYSNTCPRTALSPNRLREEGPSVLHHSRNCTGRVLLPLLRARGIPQPFENSSPLQYPPSLAFVLPVGSITLSSRLPQNSGDYSSVLCSHTPLASEVFPPKGNSSTNTRKAHSPCRHPEKAAERRVRTAPPEPPGPASAAGCAPCWAEALLPASLRPGHTAPPAGPQPRGLGRPRRQIPGGSDH